MRDPDIGQGERPPDDVGEVPGKLQVRQARAALPIRRDRPGEDAFSRAALAVHGSGQRARTSHALSCYASVSVH